MFEEPQERPRTLLFGQRNTPRGSGDPTEAARNVLRIDTKENPLDSPKAETMLNRLMGWYLHEMDVQSENRAEMAMDDDFYDHIQWTDEEIAALNARGQAPIVFNVLQTTVNWVLGMQRRGTQDYRILPRKKEGVKAAQTKSELLKHVSDENRSTFELASAFEMAVRVGLGWLECGQGRPEDGTQVYDRHEDWRCMLWDSTARKYDLMDARYIFRSKWLDSDVAENLWPHRAGVIRQAANSTVSGVDDMDGLGDEAMDSIETSHFNALGGSTNQNRTGNDRTRLRVVEAWFKLPVPDARVMRGGQFNGELFDDWSSGHWNELNAGLATLISRPREVIHVALMTDAGLLDLRPSPYRHNRYPFTPIWGYRRRRDGMPYGMIRGIRDVQRDLNKRASKALHHLSSTRVSVQEGAVEDIEVLRDEAARPDAVIVHKAGFPAPQVSSDTAIASGHIDLMSRDAEMIQAIGGVTDENLGRRTNATSGVAIERRQDQGALSTSLFFENLRQSRQIHGEKLMILLEMYYSKEEEFRITDSRGNPDFRQINTGDPDMSIADHKADFIISEEDWRASARQAQAGALLDLASKLAATAPQMVVQILDLIVEAMDVPKRDELVKRIRQLTGVQDPDADPNNPDDDTKARMAEAAAQAEVAKRQQDAALSELEAKARKANAEAAKSESAVGNDTIARLKTAFEAALQIAGAPAVAAAADQILGQAMRAEAEAKLAPQAAQQPPMPAMQEQDPMAQMGEMPADAAQPPVM